jgi:hypothetical protein
VLPPAVPLVVDEVVPEVVVEVPPAPVEPLLLPHAAISAADATTTATPKPSEVRMVSHVRRPYRGSQSCTHTMVPSGAMAPCQPGGTRGSVHRKSHAASIGERFTQPWLCAWPKSSCQ